MISYEPLYHTLISKNKKLDDLRKDGVLSTITISKFRKNESITLSTADKICDYLHCNIEDIVKVNSASN